MCRRELKENEERYIDSVGQKRRGIITYCELCGTKFLRKKCKRVSKYCSRGCFEKQATTKISVTCAYCNKQTYKNKSKIASSKHKIFFCSRKCKDIGQSLKGGIKEIQPPHFGTKPEYKRYREQYIESLNGVKPECQRCGYDEFDCSIHIHHIDENRENNDLSNLMMLCGNCHYALHFKKWQIGGVGVITNTSDLQSEIDGG